MPVARNVCMFSVLINVGNLDYRLQVLVPLPLHIMNWGMPRRIDLIGLRVIMLVDSHKNPNGYKHLDFLSIGRFKTPVAVSRVKR
jgi:hypothetical protein